MKRTIIFLIAATILTSMLSARTVRRTLGLLQNSVPETETIANEIMEFVYDYSYCVDTTGLFENNRAADRMLLQIAPGGLSKFSSYKNLAVDSILANISNEQLIAAAKEGKLSNGEFMTIFKNYPTGRLTHTEKICMDWLRYEEDIPLFDWQLTDSTTNILGYECYEAKCSFRGRDWTVFYTADIPIMDGPWKFNGLPGLIMKASDARGEYVFECIGIKSRASRPITIYKVPYNKTSREKYYDTKHRYDVNPYGYYDATTGGHITVTDGAGNILTDYYDPIELSFDYIEKDWKK